MGIQIIIYKNNSLEIKFEYHSKHVELHQCFFAPNTRLLIHLLRLLYKLYFMKNPKT